MFFCLEKGRLFSVLLRSMLQSVSADSQIDCRARIAFWLRTSISFSLSPSHCLSIYFSFFLPMLFFFLQFSLSFLCAFSFFPQSLIQSTFLIFPTLSRKRKLSSADKEYHCCLEKRIGLWRRECTEHGVTDGMQVVYWSCPKTHQVIPRSCPMDSVAWTSVSPSSDWWVHPILLEAEDAV